MKFSDLKKTYGGRTILDLGELELLPGRIYALMGHNGSGKSTLAKLISGTVKPDGGGKCSPEGLKIGFVPQKAYAFNMTVMGNILLGAEENHARLGRNEKAERKKRAQELAEAMGLEPLLKSRAVKLSGGETQKMALIRGMMRDYELLILDEPTAAMDGESTERAEKLIKDYRDRTGCTVLLITHRDSQTGRIADEVLTLDRGKLRERK